MTSNYIRARSLRADQIRIEIRDHVVAEVRRAGINTTTTILPDGCGMWLASECRKRVDLDWSGTAVSASLTHDGHKFKLFAVAHGSTVYDAVRGLIDTGKVPKAMLVKETP